MTQSLNPPSTGEQSPAVRRRNLTVIQRESAALGIVNVSGVYIAVFLIRLGGTNVDVSLLSALPALGGFLLAIPAGAYLQRRRNVIPVYTATRATQFMVFAAIAVVVAIVPADVAIVIILVIWALATIPGTISAVASNVVLNGVAGPSGRYDLISRRYGIMGLTTAIAVAIAGQVLELMGFPLNYQVVFVALSAAGLLACYFSIQLVIPDHAGPEAATPGVAPHPDPRLRRAPPQPPGVPAVRESPVRAGLRNRHDGAAHSALVHPRGGRVRRLDRDHRHRPIARASWRATTRGARSLDGRARGWSWPSRRSGSPSIPRRWWPAASW